MEGFGEKLKCERERQGFTLEDIEDETKIRKIYLRALEEERFEGLPPQVYASGFVKRYSKFLKLNPDEMVREFRKLAYGTHEVDEYYSSEKAAKKNYSQRKNLPIKNIIIAGVFLVMAVWLGSYVVGYISERNMANNIVTPDQNPIIETPDKQDDENNQSPAEMSVDQLDLIIQAKEKCWLQIDVDGETKYLDILPAGQELLFSGKSVIEVKAGNAGGIVLTLNQEVLPPIGESWEVVTKVFEVNEVVEN
ncbi:MAG: DUF4115 domain-containing protein [Bacillota bacterium]|nr:DUF4115 domain-containing protein [Bacillota bacterium]